MARTIMMERLSLKEFTEKYTAILNESSHEDLKAIIRMMAIGVLTANPTFSHPVTSMYLKEKLSNCLINMAYLV